MKICFQKLVLVGLFAIVIAGCSQNQKPPEQSMVVTAGNETAARARLHAIAAAEVQYQIISGGEFGTLDQLIKNGYLNDPSSGKLTGYRFEVQVKPGGFQATAVPEQTGISGKRSFYIDETRVMHAADKRGAPATASDPEV